MSPRRPRADPTAHLAERMGAAEYTRRTDIEQGRVLIHRHSITPQLTALKMMLAPPLISNGLRALGLYRHGYRQFLDLATRRHVAHIPGLPAALAGYTILQMSDLHLDLDCRLTDAIRATIRDLRYDLCVLTGDYRNSTVGPWDVALRELAAVRDVIPVPVYAVLGNHDFLAMVDPLERAGIRVLLNESVRIAAHGAHFHLAGIDDPNIYRTHNLARALRHVPHDTTRVLLSHSPAIHAEAHRLGIHLVLAGHTHGGQVCLPGGRILVHNDDSPRALLRGPWTWRGMRGYTSPGTGSCGIPIRFNCPPEVTLHVLQPAP